MAPTGRGPTRWRNWHRQLLTADSPTRTGIRCPIVGETSKYLVMVCVDVSGSAARTAGNHARDAARAARDGPTDSGLRRNTWPRFANARQGSGTTCRVPAFRYGSIRIRIRSRYGAGAEPRMARPGRHPRLQGLYRLHRENHRPPVPGGLPACREHSRTARRDKRTQSG